MRCRGYAPLRSYAAIGARRTVALVADDGTIDWLALPDLDSPSVFGALLDPERGGCFELAPTVPFRVARRYVPMTNVLETTFSTAGGVVRVLDAMTVQGPTLGPFRELQRRVEGVTGRVPMAWRVQPRFEYGAAGTRLAWRGSVPVAVSGSNALAVCSFQAGAAKVGAGAIAGSFEATPGSQGLLALCAAHQEPLVFPARGECDERFEQTVATWQAWAGGHAYDGPWEDMVARSALALKLLVHPRPARSRPPRRRRCRRRLAGSGTGTTGSAGFATRPSPSAPCFAWAAHRRHERTSGGSCMPRS